LVNELRDCHVGFWHLADIDLSAEYVYSGVSSACCEYERK
jgi:hypothetical protein